MKKLSLWGRVCIVVAILLSNAISTAYADTYIGERTIGVDTVWSIEGSPYVLGGPVIVRGATLTIKPGVEVRGDLAVTEDPRPAMFVEGGSLIAMGQPGDGQVYIHDIDGIFITGGVADIAHTIIMGPGGLVFERSRGIIATTTISGTYDAIRVKESNISVHDSHIYGNGHGIFVEPEGVPVLMHNSAGPYIGGIGNALDINSESSGTTTVQINNSSLENNDEYGLENESTAVVLARSNWWGSSGGPGVDGGDKISGPVDYEPWLDIEPDFTFLEKVICCSSILFIPGLQSSRLYDGENMLWEPNRNTDVKKLFLNPDGSSMQSISVGEPIDSAFGIVGVYEKFTDFLGMLQENGRISEWKAFGYDWRKSIPEVVAGKNIQYLTSATSSQSLVELVQDMAERSSTGKVTVVAHSNGGLVAKYLVKILHENSRESLIDKVISVAVPYVGTPMALAALLHGDGQSMLNGLIANQSHMRALGENMASAYSLLPSEGFFSNLFSPTIAFASTSIVGLNDGSYPTEINSIEEQNKFVVDEGGARVAPQFLDTDKPLKGNGFLMAAASILHATLDPFVWPSNIARYALVGWNIATIKGLEYAGKKVCSAAVFRKKCTDVITRAATTTYMGDGTVVVPSATYQAGSVISLDLDQMKQSGEGDIVHRNILEASSTQAVIAGIINDEVNNEKFPLPPAASWGKPDYAVEPEFLRVSTHSPVDLHVYDAQGRHTGLIPKPAQLADNDFITGAYETKISGSSFNLYSSNGSDDTYIQLPFREDGPYSIVIQGNDFGTFTFEVEAFKGGSSLGKVEYGPIPVTPLMTATTTVGDTTTSSLQVDFDGDGVSDLIAVAGVEVDPYVEADAAKKLIRSILGSDPRGQKLIKRIDHIVELVKMGKDIQATKQTEKLKWKLGHKKLKNISAADRQQIMRIIEQLFGL